VVLPVILRKVEPVYPAQASAKRLQGKVTVEAVILQSGRIASVKVLESTNPIFNDAARRAILRWRYSPATVDGKPVAIYFTVVVDFKLKRGKKK
jgi:protein TonB